MRVGERATVRDGERASLREGEKASVREFRALMNFGLPDPGLMRRGFKL